MGYKKNMQSGRKILKKTLDSSSKMVYTEDTIKQRQALAAERKSVDNQNRRCKQGEHMFIQKWELMECGSK